MRHETQHIHFQLLGIMHIDGHNYNIDHPISSMESSDTNKLTAAQSLLLKKGKKLRNILLNVSHNTSQDAPRNELIVSNESKSELMEALIELSKEPIKIVNEDSAKKRIQQWKDQEKKCAKFQIAAESYNLFHLMSLVEVYEDVMAIGDNLKLDPNNNIKSVKSWMIKFMCDNLKIGQKAEQRNRLGCTRLRFLFNEGITAEQLAQAGCRKFDFFASKEDYEIFVSQIPSLETRLSISSSNESRQSRLSELPSDTMSSSTSQSNNQVISQNKGKGKKVFFKLHLGEELAYLANNYKNDKYIDV